MDPGFPVGGGGVDFRCGCFLPKMHVKTKEFGPMGGHVPGTPPSRSANGMYIPLSDDKHRKVRGSSKKCTGNPRQIQSFNNICVPAFVAIVMK